LVCFSGLINASLIETKNNGDHELHNDEVKEWQFKVLLDNREIGFHDFRVTSNGQKSRVEASAKFKVKLLFVTVYQYIHNNVENWDVNCLSNINSKTNDNGKDLAVEGVGDKDAFIVTNGGIETQLPTCVMTFAYWNPEFLKSSQLLNAQTGVLEPVTITPDGEEIFIFNGTEIPASRYVVDVKSGPLTLWYSSIDSRWLALETVAKGGRILRYEPMAIPGDSGTLVAR
jgi:hypothetical protein